jgi:hypothetical protein
MFQELYVKLYTSSFVGVSGLRRQSIAKLHNLSIEAPITRVISLITSVQENVGTEAVQMLDKVRILPPKASCSTAMTTESEPAVGIFTKFEVICSFKVVLILVGALSFSKANLKSPV